MRRGQNCKEYHFREKGKEEPTRKPNEQSENRDSRGYRIMEKKGVVRGDK